MSIDRRCFSSLTAVTVHGSCLSTTLQAIDVAEVWHLCHLTGSVWLKRKRRNLNLGWALLALFLLYGPTTAASPPDTDMNLRQKFHFWPYVGSTLLLLLVNFPWSGVALASLSLTWIITCLEDHPVSTLSHKDQQVLFALLAGCLAFFIAEHCCRLGCLKRAGQFIMQIMLLVLVGLGSVTLYRGGLAMDAVVIWTLPGTSAVALMLSLRWEKRWVRAVVDVESGVGNT